MNRWVRNALLTGMVACFWLPAQAKDVNAEAMGKLVLPDRLEVRWEGDTLLAQGYGPGELNLRLYRAPKGTAKDPAAWVRARAGEMGIPRHSRQVSDDQRELAHIEWGGFALGTLPRSAMDSTEAADELPGTDTAEAVLSEGVDITIDTEDSSEVATELPPKELLPQPEGLPAIQRMVVVYVKNKQVYTLEMSIWIPEGNSMELTDIQRRWSF